MQTYRNTRFTKRDYECSNIVACVALEESAKVPAWFKECDDSILEGLTQLYREGDVRYYGYL